MSTKTAYLTGGASGIGLATAKMLAARGIKVAIADRNLEGAKAVAESLGGTAYQVDAADWDSQLNAFEQAVKDLGRIDYVFPIAGIGEGQSLPNDPKAQKFVKPNLAVVDVDLYGVLYTSSLAIQQMRRQAKDESGFRGKIAVTASVCGFYCCPTLPVYTAAKHGVIGYVRSFGKYLPEEGITLNAVCPNVVKTNISTDVFYAMMEEKGLLTPIEGVVAAFESFLDSDISGECEEVGPNGGFHRRAPAEALDPESAEVMRLVYLRAHPLHQPVS